ncbi:hypothetical protein E8P82_14690 [Arthrobacter echini]|uniref:Abortive infection protein-like C-terminal domain-containing protein n=1 Tax=Arthrobacter echini TaxID=1529066 RepID=A0A4S5DZX6_9MICC|nr:hypothetical protein [Arthrobacter echini]THJ64581.1 hypothetical protein E8P82_14690 [Arthrobacter echini]
MRDNDFFDEAKTADVWAVRQDTLNTDLIERIHAGPVETATDVELAVPLARLVHDEYRNRGTENNPRISVHESRAVMAALRAVLKRLGVDFKPPFSDFDGFYTYWKNNNGSNSWQARRQMLSELFDPLHEQLADLEAGTVASTLAEPVSSQPRTGWTRVDEEITELRRHFQNARTEQDYRNVGNDCVIVLERLSEAAYVRERHLFDGEEEPAVASTKNRLERVIEVDLAGPQNVALRKLVRAAIEQAQGVKHGATINRRYAGVAADSAILLANMLRRITEGSSTP